MRMIATMAALAMAATASAQPAGTGVLNGAQRAQATLCAADDGSVPVTQMVAACTSLLDTAPLTASQRADILIYRGYARAKAEPAAGRADLDQGIAGGKATPDMQALALTTRANLRAEAEPAAAFADYESAFKAMPGYVHARHGRALVAIGAGRFDLAYDDADAALKITGLAEKYYAEFLRIRGEAQVGRGNDVAALTDFNQAIRRDPGNVTAISSRGVLHRRAGRYDVALADLDAAVRLDPKSPYQARTACWTRAAYAKRDYDRARTLCASALALEPDNPTNLDSAGLVALQQQRWQDAWNAYDKALKIDPKLASARFGRGIAALRLGRTGEGNADITAAIGTEPAIAQTYSGYGQQP